ncbi:MAG: Arm DNA-binding domain-containing protein [Burkholderiaceae bacterium]
MHPANAAPRPSLRKCQVSPESHSRAWLKANSNKARPALAEFSDRDGLGVRVTPKGKIVFQLRYRYDGNTPICLHQSEQISRRRES